MSLLHTTENAQHEPHCPWFLIPVTNPFVLQSTVSERDLLLKKDRYVDPLVSLEGILPFIRLTNSSVS